MKNKQFDEQLKSIDKDEFCEYFYTHSLQEVAKHYNFPSEYFVRRAQNFFKIPAKTMQQIKTIVRSTVLEHFGELGLANESIQDKRKETCLHRYGVEHTSKLPVTQEKKRQTNQLRYGVDAPAQLDTVQQKMQQTSIDKYGEDYRKRNTEKSKQTKKIIYGDENYCNAQQGMQTKLMRYGDSNYNNHDKISQTKEMKYGDANYNNRELAVKTTLRKYGVKNSSQCAELRNKSKKRYTYRGLHFDSSWEIAFYIWAIDMGYDIQHEPIRLKLNNDAGYYFPDFCIDDQLYEIKSSYWLNHASKEKRDCMFDNYVIIISDNSIKFWLEYIKSTYGKNYLKQFRNV